MSTPTPALVELEGTSVSTGTWTPVLRSIQAMVLDFGESACTGDLTVIGDLAPGAFADFAMTPYGTAGDTGDPAVTHITSQVRRVGGGGATDPLNTWVRLSLTATSTNRVYAPGPYTIYEPFEFAEPGVTSYAMTSGETQALAYAQFERTPPGIDSSQDQIGNNLLDLEQSSYEGRLLYSATDLTGTAVDGLSYVRSGERPSCGLYAGKLTFRMPPATNSYPAVAQFGSYTNLKARRTTYVAVKNVPYTSADGGTPDPGLPTGGGTPPTGFTLLPVRAAVARVYGQITYQAQLSLAADLTGVSFRCAVIQYDANFNIIGSFTEGPSVTTTGRFQWQQASVQVTTDPNAVWAAVVPRITNSATALTAYVDEHRLWKPTTTSDQVGGTSPARNWAPPRETVVKVKGTRLNFAANPAFQTTTSRYRSVVPASAPVPTLTRVAGAGLEGGACGDWHLTDMPVESILESPAWAGVASGGQSGVRFAFDKATRLMPDFQPVAGNVHQQIAFDLLNGWMYTTEIIPHNWQLSDEGAPVDGDLRTSRGDLVITKFTLNGTEIGRMYFRSAGHGWCLVAEPVAGDTWLWTECTSAVDGIFGWGTKLARFKWVNGTIITPATSGLDIYQPVTGIRRAKLDIDTTAGQVCFGYRDGANNYQFEIHNLTAFKAKTYTPLRTFQATGYTLSSFQNWCFYGGRIHILEGLAYDGSNVAPGNTWITSLSAADGSVVERAFIDIDTTMARREPEAFTVVNYPDGPVLVQGFAVNAGYPFKVSLFKYPADLSQNSLSLVEGLKPQTTYTASLYVRKTDSLVPLTLWVHDGDTLVQGSSSRLEQGGPSTAWERLTVTFTTAVTFSGTLDLRVGFSAPDIQYVYGPVTPGTDDRVWSAVLTAPTEGAWDPEDGYDAGDVVSHSGGNWQAQGATGIHATATLGFRLTRLLVEAATLPGEYFDGNEPSGDYLWERTAGNSRSHYYRGKRANQYRLEKLIESQLGVGSSFRIIYASAP